MSWGFRAFNALGETVISTDDGALYIDVSSGALEFDISVSESGFGTLYGYKFPSTPLIQDSRDLLMFEIGVNRWICNWGLLLNFSTPFGTFQNKMRDGSAPMWLISNVQLLRYFIFSPLDDLPPPSIDYGIEVFNDAGNRVWSSAAISARITAGAVYDPNATPGAQLGTMSDPSGAPTNLVGVPKLGNFTWTKGSSSPWKLQGTVVRGLDRNTVVAENRVVDFVEAAIDPDPFLVENSQQTIFMAGYRAAVGLPVSDNPAGGAATISGSWTMSAANLKIGIGYIEGENGSLSNTSGTVPKTQIYEETGTGIRSEMVFDGNFVVALQEKTLSVNGQLYPINLAQFVVYDQAANETRVIWYEPPLPVYVNGGSYDCIVA